MKSFVATSTAADAAQAGKEVAAKVSAGIDGHKSAVEIFYNCIRGRVIGELRVKTRRVTAEHRIVHMSRTASLVLVSAAREQG